MTERWSVCLARALLLVCLLMPAGPQAQTDFPDGLGVGLGAGLKAAGQSVVMEVVDGDTVALADGRELRLVGIQAPKLPLGRKGFTAWPLAEEARQALADLVQGREVTLAYGGAKRDRYGRLLAHLARGDGLWVQCEMLRRGLARVYLFRDNRAAAAELLACERDARAARRGIWAHPFYAVRRPEETADLIGSFQLVEGRVRQAAEVRGKVYLNYGPDHRTDFTVSIAPRERRAFDKAGVDLLDLEGHRIRVRGWLSRRNGPMIEASHPEQIELLAEQIGEAEE